MIYKSKQVQFNLKIDYTCQNIGVRGGKTKMVEMIKEKGTGLYSVWNGDIDDMFKYATIGKVKDLVERGIIDREEVEIDNEEKWMSIRESNNEMIIFDTLRDAKTYYCKLLL